jgi:excisionase family DNA binding protein
MEDQSEHRLLAPNEVAAICGLSRKAVYRAVERGELRASKLCSRLRITPEDVERWITESLVETASRPEPRPAHVPAPNGLRALLRQSSSGVAA